MSKYTYELSSVVSIDADNDAEAIALFDKLNESFGHGELILEPPFARTDNETGETEEYTWEYTWSKERVDEQN
jgi:hypothetical protein